MNCSGFDVRDETQFGESGQGLKPPLLIPRVPGLLELLAQIKVPRDARAINPTMMRISRVILASSRIEQVSVDRGLPEVVSILSQARGLPPLT